MHEARKAEKRQAAASLKEKLEAFVVELVMPAGPNGKLYGAVTNQTIAEELNKNGFEIERKRIEVPGIAIKSVGKYHANIRLYEATTAEITVVVTSQEEASAKAAEKKAEEAKVQEEVKNDEASAEA